MGIDSFNWYRENLRKETAAVRGPNYSLRNGLGVRQLDRSTAVGGPTGTALATGAVRDVNLSTVNFSTPLNAQSTALPLISDATALIQTFGSGNTTVDSYIYGVGGAGTPISVQRPDGSVMLVPAYHMGHDFGSTGVHVYALMYYSIWAKAWQVSWQSSQFSAVQFAAGQGDGMVPVLVSPYDSNIGMVTGTSGSYTKTNTGPGFTH